MANGVYCKHCVHEPECYSAMKKHGIVTYVEGLVDCNGYQEVEYVAITRCRDCKHRFESMTIKAKDGNAVQFGHYCKATGQIVSDDDFCAWAERRTDNT